MYSAPAVLRLPVPADMLDDEAAYPWAVNTPEASPRLWGIEPNQPIVSSDTFQTVCNPIYEQMCWHVASNADVLGNMHSVACRESTQLMCQPYFDQMVTSLQQALQQTHIHQDPYIMQNMKHTMAIHAAPAFAHWDDASTEADEPCAFASLLSGPSSEGNEDSEAASDTEKSIMVCRHWKSKGWCRMESKCKFLHLEHKRGVSLATKVEGSSEAHRPDGESAAPATSTTRSKKRGGKNRSNRGQQAQLDTFQQSEFQGYVGEQYNECFPCIAIA